MPLEMSDLTPLPSNEKVIMFKNFKVYIDISKDFQVKEIFLKLKAKLKTGKGIFKSCLGINKCLILCGAVLR